MPPRWSLRSVRPHPVGHLPRVPQLLHCSKDQGDPAILVVCEVNVSPEKYDPKYVANAQNGSALVIVDQFIDDASFAMLRELSASYSLPEKWAHYARATRASFTVAGRNLNRWTSYPGLDPESRSLGTGNNPYQNAFDQGVTPTLAQFIATLNLTF